MFPILCVLTFTTFTLYWLIQLLYLKITTSLQQQQSHYKININTCEDEDEDEGVDVDAGVGVEVVPVVPQKQKQKQYVSKVTNTSDNPQKYTSQAESNDNGSMVLVGVIGKSGEYSIGSDGNQLDVAMIEDNVSNIEDREGKGKVQGAPGKLQQIHINKNYPSNNNSNILGQIVQGGQIRLGQYVEQDRNQAEQQQQPKEIPQAQLHEEKQPRQQRSQLEIIQALSTTNIHRPQPNNTNTNNNNNNNNNLQIQQISQVVKKQSQSDTITSKLIQQIDQLFLTNQQEFMNVINKYKVQEARYGTQNDHDSQFYQSRQKQKYIVQIQKLEEILKKKNEERDILEIQLSEYKGACEAKQAEIQAHKQKIANLQTITRKLATDDSRIPHTNSTILMQQLQKQAQQQNKQISSYQQILKQHQQIQQAYHKSELKLSQQLLQIKQKQQEINKLTAELNSSKQQISRLCANLEEEKSSNSKMMQEYSQLERDFDFNYGVIENLRNQLELYKKKEGKGNDKQVSRDQGKTDKKISQNDYMEKLAEFEQEIQRIRDQATTEKKKYDELLILYNQQTQQNLSLNLKQPNNQYIPISTRQNLIQSRQDQLHQLQRSHENLKNQIQFAQTQIRMFEETQASYIKQIEQLQRLNESSIKQISDLRSKISRMQPLVNQYDIMQRRYFELKLKYQKLLHERPQLNNSGSNQVMNQSRRRQETPIQTMVPNSPKNSRFPNPNINIDSPSSGISNDNNNNKNTPSTPGNYRFLFDCAFISLQDREFVYETIRSLLKGVLKTQKLYNSKTNRSKNPHDLIDNIRGILLLIQLQNDKILGAYTHECFTSIHPQCTNDNIAFILDVTNRRSFTNQSGLNSITYNPHSIVWGFNEIMLKHEQSQVMYTNFCRNHNIYWDGKYRIEDFIGSDKQWARIHQYQLFRVTKI